MSIVELSLVMPVKDEEAAIGPCLARVIPVLEAMDDPASQSFEIVFVDDGSSDTTLEVIREANAADPRVRGLSLSRNFGKEAALSAGLDVAKGRAVVPLDVDLQDPPEALPKMIAKWRSGYDVVYGVRDNRETDSLPKRLTADLYYRAHNWLSSDKIPEHAGDFRLLDRRVVDVIRQMPERNRFMKGLFAWAGFRQAAVSYHREERKVGVTKYNYWKLWTLAIDGITSASTVPLRIWSYLGAFVALGALGYAIFIVIRTLTSGIEVPGYASMMVAVLFLGGLQLLSLGVLGEYVGRILTETKARPLYVIRERIGEELMERKVYEQMALLDSKHWWFTARRRILQALIERVVKPPKEARILELGSGTGHNLAMLSQFGAVEASELDPVARQLASERLGRPVLEAALPNLSMFPANSYDLIALLDVLEHVPDDKASLEAIIGRLKPGGTLLLTVPANPWMWSAHDVAHHHHRRYRKGEIEALARGAGYEIELLSPFNSLLFPPIAVARFIGRLRGDESSDDAMPGDLVNQALDTIFGLERSLIGRVPMPFGVSLAAVLRRPRA